MINKPVKDIIKHFWYENRGCFKILQCSNKLKQPREQLPAIIE